jgi:hypothetical protein
LTVLLALFPGLKARREELWLLDRYPAYAEYRQRTPRKFLPFSLLGTQAGVEPPNMRAIARRYERLRTLPASARTTR